MVFVTYLVTHATLTQPIMPVFYPERLRYGWGDSDVILSAIVAVAIL